jgi:hypothetical protein
MRMKKEDFATLKRFLKPVLDNLSEYEKLYKDAGLSEMRLRWDAFYSSGIKIGDGVGIKTGDIIDPGLNMDHIDTALRKLFGHKKEKK